MPSNQTPLGALPARFRRERLLIVGCGDVGLRAARFQRHVRVLALTSSPERVQQLRAQGITPLQGNLDDAASVRRLAGLATRVLHLAPPAQHGQTDMRSQHLSRALLLRTAPKHLVYGSTSGVYGDCQGAWVNETRSLAAQTPRALRRVDAEAQLRVWALRSGATLSILRIPGIYALDREGGTPRERLLRGTPVLQAADDVFTNHIQADDLARACLAALWRGKPQRSYNVNDDTQLKMGDYFDLAADILGLPQPPRISRAEAHTRLPAMQLSFMSESRRLDNTRMKRELRLRFRYPHTAQGLSQT